MRIIFKLIALIVMGVMVFPVYGERYQSARNRDRATEYRTVVGVDAIVRETEIIYLNGSETYKYSGFRLRYGIESSEGASMGIEYIPGGSDEQIDPFGALFRLETGDTLGVYFTIGKPFHFRLGWSIWESTYTRVSTGESVSDTLSALELGLGLNASIGSNFSVFADYSVRNTTVNFSPFILGSGEVDHETTLLSLGVNYIF